MRKILFILSLLILTSSTVLGQGNGTEQVLKQLGEISQVLSVMKKEQEARMQKNEAAIVELRERMSRLEKRLEMQSLADKSTYKSAKVDYGRLLIINTWNGTAQVRVNGELYHVLSGTSQTIRVAAGKISYKVISDPRHTMRHRNIASGETIRLNVFNAHEPCER